MSVEIGVLMSASMSTSLWPAGTEVAKGLMPIYIYGEAGAESQAIPIAHLAAREFAVAGLTRVIAVVPEGPQGDMLESFLTADLPEGTVDRAIALGKSSRVDAEQDRRQRGYGDIRFEFIGQPLQVSAEGGGHQGEPYGTAFVLHLLRDTLHAEVADLGNRGRFIVRNIDDILLTHKTEKSELETAIRNWEGSGADHLIMGYPMPRELSETVGVLILDEHGRLGNLLEKPKPDEIPHDLSRILGNIGYYGFSDNIWGPLYDEMHSSGTGGEHLITDVILRALSAGQSFYVHRIDSMVTRRFDGGKAQGLLEASKFLSQNASLYI